MLLADNLSKTYRRHAASVKVLHGLSLQVQDGEFLSIVGASGSGKSTLSKVLCGHEDYEVTGGEVLLTGERIVLPNSQVVAGATHNYSRPAPGGKFVLATQVTIGYDTPWRQVHAMLLEAARNTPGIRAEPAPFVIQTALDDFYVRYSLRCVTPDPIQAPFVKSALLGQVQGNGTPVDVTYWICESTNV